MKQAKNVTSKTQIVSTATTVLQQTVDRDGVNPVDEKCSCSKNKSVGRFVSMMIIINKKYTTYTVAAKAEFA